MNIFLDEHKKLVSDMLVGSVEFILIGGYAVNFHDITEQQAIWMYG